MTHFVYIYWQLIINVLTIQERFLEHHTVEFLHCKPLQLGNQGHVVPHHSSIRRIFGSQMDERTLDELPVDHWHQSGFQMGK